MQISPASALPINLSAPDDARLAARAGRDFEALLITRLLKTARAASLGDDLMGGSEQIKDLIDEQRGRLIADAAPLGLAQLIAKGATGSAAR